ncbi:MAG: T9SS type A sorting domain-containing protein [Lishizhenia sp.]
MKKSLILFLLLSWFSIIKSQVPIVQGEALVLKISNLNYEWITPVPLITCDLTSQWPAYEPHIRSEIILNGNDSNFVNIYIKDCYYFEWEFTYSYEKYIPTSYQIEGLIRVNTFIDTNTVDTLNCPFKDFFTALDSDTIEINPQQASLIENQSQISIYPNPATTHLNIKANNVALIESVEITSMDGTTVLKQKKPEKMPIAHLTAGVYFIHVRYDNAVVTKKFVKE